MQTSRIPAKYTTPHYNGRLFKALYSYVASRYGSAIFQEACAELGLLAAHIVRDNAWFSDELTSDLLSVLKHKTGDPLLSQKAGQISSAPDILNPLEYFILSSYPSPYLLLRLMPVQYSKFNRFNSVTVERAKPGYFVFRVRPKGQKLAHPDVCLNTEGMLSAIRHLFDLEYIEVTHPSCAHRGQGDCRFEVRYSAGRLWLRRIRAGFLFLSAALACAISITLALFALPDPARLPLLISFSSVLVGILVFLIYRHLYVAGYITNYFEQSVESARLVSEERAETERLEALELLAKSVAHDIRGPLGALRVAISLPSTEAEPLIYGAIDRISKITASLLEIRSSEINSCCPATVVLSLLSEKRSLSSSSITFIPDVGTTATIKVRSSELARVLSNILDNSIEALLDGGTITISVRQEGHECILSVRDNGLGIPRSVLNKIGEKYFTYGKQQGHGLGLYLAKKFALENGGKFEIHSKEALGTEVILSFPCS